MKKLTLNLICVAFMLSSCKKDQQMETLNSSNQTSSLTNSTASTFLFNATSSTFFKYLETLPYQTAIDTLKKRISDQASINLNKTVNSKKILAQNSVAVIDDPSDITPDMEQFVSATISQDLPDDVFELPYDKYTKTIPVEWNVATNIYGFFKVTSREQVQLTYVAGPGISQFSRYISAFSHSGSFYSQTGPFPFNIATWSESMNEHYPLTLGPGVNNIAPHIKGALTFLDATVQADNWILLNAF